MNDLEQLNTAILFAEKVQEDNNNAEYQLKRVKGAINELLAINEYSSLGDDFRTAFSALSRLEERLMRGGL